MSSTPIDDVHRQISSDVARMNRAPPMPSHVACTRECAPPVPSRHGHTPHNESAALGNPRDRSQGGLDSRRFHRCYGLDVAPIGARVIESTSEGIEPLPGFIGRQRREREEIVSRPVVPRVEVELHAPDEALKCGRGHAEGLSRRSVVTGGVPVRRGEAKASCTGVRGEDGGRSRDRPGAALPPCNATARSFVSRGSPTLLLLRSRPAPADTLAWRIARRARGCARRIRGAF